MFTVQYIPLSKIKPDHSVKITSQIRKLRDRMWDCMHVLVVRKNGKHGSYMILFGNERFEYLTNHTKKLVAPCLVDESNPTARASSWFQRFHRKQILKHLPAVKAHRLTPVAWSIVRTFLREEPRFEQLTRRQQLQVLVQAIRYKKIVVASMKSKIDQMSLR